MKKLDENFSTYDEKQTEVRLAYKLYWHQTLDSTK